MAEDHDETSTSENSALLRRRGTGGSYSSTGGEPRSDLRTRNNNLAAGTVGSRSSVTISWSQIGYRVETKTGPIFRRQTQEKVILENLNGIVQPGQLLAIIGPSGAGKSSLLDVLSGRKSQGQQTGQVLINGAPRSRYFKRISGYVTQDDCLIGNLTVRETFRFHAAMRMQSTPNAPVTAEVREARVQAIIDELGLNRAADQFVGTQFRRGISGGEKKRVSIGCELLTDPGLLFLDEPTSGLDAYNSLSVMKTLRKLARRGRTIVCTIHQPRSTIFELFDQLLILSHGRQVYFGPANTVLNHFSQIGLPCPQYTNPADYLLDTVVKNEKAHAIWNRKQNPLATPTRGPSHEVIGSPNDPENPPQIDEDEVEFDPDEELIDDDDSEDDETQDNSWKNPTQPPISLHEAFSNSPLSANLIQHIADENARASKIQDPRHPSKYATNWFTQLMWLIWRTVFNYYRNPMVTYIQMFQTIFFAILVGLIYFQIKGTLSALQDRLGAIFFIMTNQCFSTLGSLNNFLEERNIYHREQQSGMYYTSAYFFAKTVIEGPTLLIFPIVFGTIAYWMIGLNPEPENYLIFIGGLMCFAATAASLFLSLGALSPSAIVAQILSPLVVVLFLLFGGFYVNNDNIPVYFVWLKQISFFNWGFGILVYNELRDFNNGIGFLGKCDCSEIPDCVCCNFPNVTLINNSTCKYYVSGEQELVNLGLQNTKLWENFVILLGMIACYRIIAYLALRFLYKEKR